MSSSKQRDDEKRAADKMHEIRERGIADVNSLRDIHVLHPGGRQVALDRMLQNPSQVRDMTQDQLGEASQRIRERNKQR